MEVRTRFAPSPTGQLHIGGLRTAAYAYALAKHSGGKFILRIEDTDQKRNVPGAKEKIVQILERFGLNWDEGPFPQSERLPLYQSAAKELVQKGYAYETGGAIKLKVPKNEIISYRDLVFKEEISWNSNDVFEPVLLKSDGFPTYHLAVVVDDCDMQITHVLRGYDWMPSTPIHLLVYKYLGFEPPLIGHLTDIQDPQGGKMSKRKGALPVEEYLDQGYLPEALLNFIILLGWAPKDNRELFTLSEFVEVFGIDGLQKSNPRFNPQKLDWFNQQYIRALDNVDLGRRVQNCTKRSESDIAQVTPLVKDRMVTLKDFDSLTEYFFATPKIDPKLFSTIKADPGEILDHASKVLKKSWDGKILEEKARKFCAEKNIKVGDYFMILRIAMTARTATPPLWDVMEIVGKEESLERLTATLNLKK